MKTIEVEGATGSLSAYAKQARREPLLLTLRGKPYATLTRVAPGTDAEAVAVATSPVFQAIVERSRRSYEEQGGLTTDEVRERLGLPRKVPRKVRKTR